MFAAVTAYQKRFYFVVPSSSSEDLKVSRVSRQSQLDAVMAPQLPETPEGLFALSANAQSCNASEQQSAVGTAQEGESAQQHLI